MTKFQNLLFTIVITSLFFSCGKDNEANFTLTGSIKDLKKGVVYLQKDGDSMIIDLDSVSIKGEPNFTLQTTIEEPVLLYLKLDKNDGQDYFIPFFADKGVTEINTSLKNFNSDSKITGSKQQALLEDYLKLMSDFNDNNLDLIKANYEAMKQNDTITSDSLVKRSQRLLKLKYASTINFALNNKDSEVAPYLALYEIPNTSVKYLDSIYNNLTDNIKQSYYGKTLGSVLEDYKKTQDSLK
ncbi:DUF4369 domain-containing protein [uncultured Winogradskyella sp.]|uniref:DUF4369 domain-containing protein n=1 Tax=uncultured Winogradskyella sp. TaxID=395353 RepID=UPI00260A4108|nr:DUF4369 domain-containing protein [uncultured Winogradskyella sp.]